MTQSTDQDISCSTRSEPDALEVWLGFERDLGRAPNTVTAYQNACIEFGRYCRQENTDLANATPETVASYVRHLRDGDRNRRANAEATIRLKICALRLFFDFLVETKEIAKNPVRRGIRGHKRGLISTQSSLPWIPSDDEWDRLSRVAAERSSRTRAMYILAYDAALRRSELTLLQIRDIDFANKTVRVRAETSKSGCSRIVPISEHAARALSAYLPIRRKLSREGGRLFLSESPRNKAKPIGLYTWTKEVELIAERAELANFTTHGFRHLRLTDLARAGWDIKRIKDFAGHTSLASTQIYIHLSVRDLRDSFSNAASDFRMRMMNATPI